MALHILHREQLVKTSLERAWAFFSNPFNLRKITPPEMRMVVHSELSERPVYDGLLIRYRVRPFPWLAAGWVSRIEGVRPLESFRDVQLQGPFRRWEHLHRFVQTRQGILITDDILYELHLSPLSEPLHEWLVRPRLERLFAYRRAAVERIFSPSPGEAALRPPTSNPSPS